MTKKVLHNRVLPIILAVIMAFTFCTVPFQVEAVAPLVVYLGYGALWATVGIFAAFSTRQVVKFTELDWQEFATRLVYDRAIDIFIDRYCIRADYQFSSPEEKEAAEIICSALNNAEAEGIRFTYEGYGVTLSPEQVRKISQLGFSTAISYRLDEPVNESGAPMSYVGRNANFDMIVKDTSESKITEADILAMADGEIEIGGKTFPVFKHGTPINLIPLIESLPSNNMGNTASTLVPFFEHNGNFYIYYSKNHGSKLIYHGAAIYTYALYPKYNICNFAGAGLNYGSANYTQLGLSTANPSLPVGSNTIFRFNLDSTLGAYPYAFTNGNESQGVYFQDYFLNCTTNTVYTSSDLGLTYSDVMSKTKIVLFSDIKSNNPYTGYYTAWFSNNLIGFKGTSKDMPVKVIPKPKEEDTIERAIQSGLVSPTPGISITEDGAISVDGISINELEKTLEQTQTGEGESTNPQNPKPKIPNLDLDLPVITKKFPFSLPWDLYAAFTILAAEPEAPAFRIPLSNVSEGDYESGGTWYSANGRKKFFALDYELVIDLKEYQIISTISRSLIFVVFLLGLIMATNKLIGRGG